MRSLLSCSLVLFAACYRPQLEDACAVRCAVDLANDDRGPCPSGLACSAAGICTNPDGTCGPAEPIDSPGGELCFGHPGSLLTICVPAPAGTVTFPGTRIDTDLDARCLRFQTSSPASELCVLTAGTFSIPAGSTVTAFGSRPLVLVASETIVIAGTLDVSSSLLSRRGAGASYHGCMAVPQPASLSGGAGGTFGSPGGAGGDGPNGDGGAPAMAEDIAIVRGGCSGMNGGETDGGYSRGGHSGGAAYLIAGPSGAPGAIIVDGTIDASGGGSPSGGPVGGGGGGSGGLIGLDGIVSGAGRMFANGGGGSSGGSTSGNGADGSDAIVGPGAALGGEGPNGGPGGTGSYGAIPAMPGGSEPDRGGGGGGGGAGVIVVYPRSQDLTDLKISPSPN